MIGCGLGEREFGCAAGAFGVFGLVGNRRARGLGIGNRGSAGFEFAGERLQSLRRIRCHPVRSNAVFFKPRALTVEIG